MPTLSGRPGTILQACPCLAGGGRHMAMGHMGPQSSVSPSLHLGPSTCLHATPVPLPFFGTSFFGMFLLVELDLNSLLDSTPAIVWFCSR